VRLIKWILMATAVMCVVNLGFALIDLHEFSWDLFARDLSQAISYAFLYLTWKIILS
jgi:hypothetical protein